MTLAVTFLTMAIDSAFGVGLAWGKKQETNMRRDAWQQAVWEAIFRVCDRGLPIG